MARLLYILMSCNEYISLEMTTFSTSNHIPPCAMSRPTGPFQLEVRHFKEVEYPFNFRCIATLSGGSEEVGEWEK